MEAVLTHDFNDGRVEEVERPDITEDEVLIAIEQVQLSVTDCWLYRGEDALYYEKVKERIDSGDNQLFGHEFCGRIAERGDSVSEFGVGDRVSAPGKISCGDCPYCLKGFRSHCAHAQTIGLQTAGALAEYIALPTDILCHLPDSISDAEGAALQPVVSSLLCVHDADIKTGDRVAVIGSGVMGFQCGQIALHQGADQVFAIDIEPRRLELAEERGMEVINAKDSDPIDEVLESTDGIGTDVVFEAVGGQQSNATIGTDPLAQAYKMVRRGGTILQVGLINSDISMTPLSMRDKMVRWVNPRDICGIITHGLNSNTAQSAVDLVASNRVSISENITHEVNGLESFEEAIEITLNKPDYNALGPAQISL
jgi:threonine dehydrogenase-like Zn-dependent dehydrogenase